MIHQSDDYSELYQKIQSLHGSKILLVEDNEINHEIIKGLLEGSGIVLDIAINEKEGFQKYKNNTYELTLMDLVMPIMNGYQATKMIRQENSTIPIVALSADALVEDIQKTKEYGMNAHITKPIDVQVLYKTLLEYIPKKRHAPSPLQQQEQQKSLDTFAHFKTLHVEEALHLIGGNKQLYEKILQNFQTNYSTISFQDMDRMTLERTLHTMKGLSKNIGAAKLHDLLLLQDDYSKEELLKNLQEGLKDIFCDIAKSLFLEELVEMKHFMLLKEVVAIELYLGDYFNKTKCI